MLHTTRRHFLATSALTIAGVSFGVRRLSATELASGVTPATFLPVPMTADVLEALASRAIEAAKTAGASYADIRVAAMQDVTINELPTNPLHFSTNLRVMYGFGVRALVNGVWGFVHGIDLTVDAIVQAARTAVEQARVNASVIPVRMELAPAPVATGVWRVPATIDPFAVPLHEQMTLIGSWGETTRRVLGAGGSGGAGWTRETRVVANTEGTLVTQHFLRSRPYFNTGAYRLRGRLGARFAFPSLRPSSGGYETIIGSAMHEALVSFAEEVNRLALLPGKTLDVGRYPAVFDGVTLGTVLTQTVGSALEMDRVLGDEADAAGTSYLSPVDAVIGTTICSPLLNVTAGRMLPSITSAKWDDEGVEITPSAVIREGRVMDYQTTRSYAPTLRNWYQRQGVPLASRACAVAVNADAPVYTRCGDLAVEPGTTRASIEDLIKDMERGIVVRETPYVATDQQLASVNMSGAQFFEVERGKIVHRLGGIALQFATLPFWKSITALGDATTVRQANGATIKGIPWGSAWYQASAPAAAFKAVDVVDIGRQV